MGERTVRRREAFRLRVMARWLFVVTAALAGALPAGATCVRQSGERTVALVELYVGQRCAGCLAAETWLARLTQQRSADELLPLMLHVDYVDYVGQSDERAARRLLARERKLLLRQRTALVYTPQVLLQGRHFQAWQGRGFAAALERIQAQPARARLQLALRPAPVGELAVHVDARVLDPLKGQDAVLFLAAVARRLNEPPRLLEWQGPFAPRPDGAFAEERRLALLPGTAPADSGVVAFVQDRGTGEVLQALLLAACSP
jgi:hypothetical protein